MGASPHAEGLSAMKWLSKDKGAADRDERSLRDQLLDNFRRAKYGATCRTLAFPTQIDGESEYYRATATTPFLDQWMVQRVVDRAVLLEESNLPVATDNIKPIIVKEKINFFDAIEYLARFEVTSFSDPVGQDRDALGAEHYETFAMRHEILFDASGMPQPTINGQIVTDNAYAKQMLEKFNEVQSQKLSLSDQGSVWLCEQFKQKSKLDPLVENYLRNNKIMLDGTALIQIVKPVTDLFDHMWRNKSAHVWIDPECRDKPLLRLAQRFEGRVEREYMADRTKALFSLVRRDAKSPIFSGAAKDLIETFLDELESIALTQEAVYLTHTTGLRDNEKNNWILKSIRNRYLELQGGGLTARFNPYSAVRKEFDDIVRNAIFLDHVPPHITKIVRGLENGRATAMEVIKSIMRKTIN